MKRTVTCHNRIRTKSLEMPAEKLTWRLSAYGILIQDNRVLLSRQWDGWDFPGGGIEKGEGVEEALLREFKEEIGISIESNALLHITQDFFILDFLPDTYWHGVLMYFTCKNPQGEISTDGFMDHETEYMQAAEWVPLENIDSIKFYNPIDSPAIIRLANQRKSV